MRPRAGSIGSSSAARPRAGSIGSSPAGAQANPMKQRLLRKLDIKPHQSPRRSAMQQQQVLRSQDSPASPLMLGGKPAPENNKDIPEVQLESQQSRRATTTKSTRAKAAPAKKTRPVPAKRRKTGETTSVQTNPSSGKPQRRSLRKTAKRSQTYRDTDGSGSSGSEPDDDRDEDVNPDDLDLPEDEMNVYVPARERATMWAKSLLRKDEDGEEGDNKEGENPQALVVREKKTPVRRRRSNSNASSVSSIVTNIGAGLIPRSKMEELLKKEPSQMTMGELALTVPKGRRMKRHEREEAAADTPLLTGSNSEASSSLLNVNALNRVRSLSVSSESAAFAGSLVTPQVQIVDGQMVVLENTIKLGDELQRTADALGEGSVGGEHMGGSQLLDDGDSLPDAKTEGAEEQVQIRGEEPLQAHRDSAASVDGPAGYGDGGRHFTDGRQGGAAEAGEAEAEAEAPVAAGCTTPRPGRRHSFDGELNGVFPHVDAAGAHGGVRGDAERRGPVPTQQTQLVRLQQLRLSLKSSMGVTWAIQSCRSRVSFGHRSLGSRQGRNTNDKQTNKKTRGFRCTGRTFIDSTQAQSVASQQTGTGGEHGAGGVAAARGALGAALAGGGVGAGAGAVAVTVAGLDRRRVVRGRHGVVVAADVRGVAGAVVGAAGGGGAVRRGGRVRRAAGLALREALGHHVGAVVVARHDAVTERLCVDGRKRQHGGDCKELELHSFGTSSRRDGAKTAESRKGVRHETSALRASTPARGGGWLQSPVAALSGAPRWRWRRWVPSKGRGWQLLSDLLATTANTAWLPARQAVLLLRGRIALQRDLRKYPTPTRRCTPTAGRSQLGSLRDVGNPGLCRSNTKERDGGLFYKMMKDQRGR
ncbi:hypothetical protein ON010_g9755 [Phytophthora cinnamomi]|nr:hypothetical protein ON010_g9755 [Phytophthora cinnamomi]